MKYSALRMLIILWALLGASANSAQAIVGRDSSIDSVFSRIMEESRRSDISGLQRAEVVEALYASWATPNSKVLAAMPEREVRTAFHAAYFAAGFNARTAYIDDMYRFRAELERRHADTASETEGLFKVLVAARRFDEARILSRGKPSHFEDIPTITGDRVAASEPRLLVPSEDGHGLDVRGFRFSPNYTVIVISHPLCHFSRNASQDIRADASLNGLLSGHVLWLEPADGRLDLSATATWMREIPGQPVALMYSRQDWPLLSPFDTPVFYVFKGKTLVGTKTGWAGPEDKPALERLVLQAKGN